MSKLRIPCALIVIALVAIEVAGAASFECSERVVAGGGAGEFATVRHLRLVGSQREIGARLAELAAERHGWRPDGTADPRQTRAQRRYFERNAPLFVERMRGVADTIGGDVADDDANVASLSFGFFKPGCTVTYYPPSATDWGGGVVSRNFDFTTGTFRGKRPGPDEVSVNSQTYILETHPDEGYASLSLCAYDLLGGVVDGINEKGLVVALLADDEVSQRYELDGADGPQAGFGVVQIGRHLLETCADVEEAKQALLEAKLYYGTIPCHYLVADAAGRSFVWENSVFMTKGYIFDGGGRPQVTSNFMHHLNPDRTSWELESHRWGAFRRAEAVLERLDEASGPVSLDFVRESSACVAATAPAPDEPWAPGRTLWHALYFPEERRLEIDFYLGEDEEGVERRSPYRTFSLDVDATAAPAERR